MEILAIEQDPTEDLGRLGQWLTDAGLAPQLVRPHAGDALPHDVSVHAAVVVTGGGPAEAPWHPDLESLLRRAVRYRVPTLAVGSGAHLLAAAHGGQVAPAAEGPAYGPALAARRDAAGHDPLFNEVPFTPDVLHWHRDEVAALPQQAVLLAASLRCAHEAFRVGATAWGLCFHIEADTSMVAHWAERDAAALRDAGVDPAQVRDAVAAVRDDLAEVWQPFADRFAALVRGERDVARPGLPMMGQ